MTGVASPSEHSLIRRLFLPAILPIVYFTLALLIYRDILSLPFIQDDWGILRAIHHEGGWKFILNAFSPTGDGFYRPVGKAYFLLLSAIFGDQPAGYHWMALLLHTMNALLVSSVAQRMTGHVGTGVAAGAIYLVAAGIHIDTLCWVVGAYDLLGALFFLLSLRLYQAERYGWSALSFALALLSKEGTILLPFVLLAGAMRGWGKIPLRASLRLTAWHFALAVILGGIQTARLLSGSAAGGDPSYAPSFSPLEAGRSLLVQGRWLFECAFPFIPPSWSVMTGAACLFLLLISFLLFRKNGLPGRFLFLLVWALAGFLPALVLPHHQYRYYLTYAFPALLVMGISMIVLAAGKKRFLAEAVLLLIVLVVGLAAGNFVHGTAQMGFDTPTVDGSNNLFRKGAIVTMVRSHLLGEHPFLPGGTVIVFDWLPVIAFSRDAGPQLWYDDPSLRCFEIQEVREELAGLAVTPAGRPPELLHPARVLYCEFHGDSLRSRFLQ